RRGAGNQLRGVHVRGPLVLAAMDVRGVDDRIDAVDRLRDRVGVTNVRLHPVGFTGGRTSPPGRPNAPAELRGELDQAAPECSHPAGYEQIPDGSKSYARKPISHDAASRGGLADPRRADARRGAA